MGRDFGHAAGDEGAGRDPRGGRAAHARHLRVAAHIHNLPDAPAVVAAGVDIVTHGVRDRPVPREFAAGLKRRAVWYIATLELDEATVAWAERQPRTPTRFARAALSPERARRFDAPAWAAQSRWASGPTAHASLAMNLRNLKTLRDAGVKIGFGTDSGAAVTRVPGIAEHREPALSVAAGLTPCRRSRSRRVTRPRCRSLPTAASCAPTCPCRAIPGGISPRWIRSSRRGATAKQSPPARGAMTPSRS